MREKEGHLMSGATDNFPSFSEGLSLRDYKCKATKTLREFPFLFGGTFIEGCGVFRPHTDKRHFPSFSEGLSLRDQAHAGSTPRRRDFPSFSEGLSLRVTFFLHRGAAEGSNFPSFSEGLSLREVLPSLSVRVWVYFPSFSEGLSLREPGDGA